MSASEFFLYDKLRSVVNEWEDLCNAGVISNVYNHQIEDTIAETIDYLHMVLVDMSSYLT